jgi:superfamily II DNA helicase RecQ
MESSNSDRQHQWVEQHKLNAMFGYCEAATCRRKVILNYFGEAHDGDCGNCDNCLYPVETWDGTIAAQKVMSCISRTGQRFGASHVVDVLLGKDTAKVQRFRHQQLSTFGIGEELNATEWRAVIRQLVAADLLQVDVDGYGSIRLSPDCGPILRGEQQVHFRKDPKPPSKKKRKKAATDAVLPPTPDARALFEAPASTAARASNSAVWQVHARALGCGLITIALPAFSETRILKIAVEVGFVVGTTAAITPTGTAYSISFCSGISRSRPMVRIPRILRARKSAFSRFLATLSGTLP